MNFYGFVRLPDGSELQQPLEINGSGLSVEDFQQSGGLQWLARKGITTGSHGFDLVKGEKKTVSVSIAARSDFGTGSFDVDLFQRHFLSDGITENKKKFVKYENATFHNLSFGRVKEGLIFGVHFDNKEVTKSITKQEIQSMFPNSIGEIKKLSDAIRQGNAEVYLQGTSKQLESNVEKMKEAIIQGLRITEWAEYKTHLPVFLDLNEKYVGFDKFFGAIGASIPELIGVYAEKARQQPLNAKDVIADLQSRALAVDPDSFNKALYYDTEELTRIMRILEMHDKLMNKIATMSDNDLKRYTLEHLYKDSVELYVKVLKELYVKAHNKKPKNNEELYSFFKNYPPLWDSAYNKMRTDTSHRLFIVYDEYSDEDLHRYANVILVKALTGIIAKTFYLANLYKQALPMILMGLQVSDASNISQNEKKN